MTQLTRLKLSVAVAGIVVWAVGVRTGEERLKWAGIAILAVAFLLRLLNGRWSAGSDAGSAHDEGAP